MLYIVVHITTMWIRYGWSATPFDRVVLPQCMVWCGWSATPGYSSSWMTRREQSCGLPTIVLYDMVRCGLPTSIVLYDMVWCGLPTTNLVKLTTHLPSPTIIIVALKRFNLLSCLDSCSFITLYLTASILMSSSLCPAQHATCIVYPA